MRALNVPWGTFIKIPGVTPVGKGHGVITSVAKAMAFHEAIASFRSLAVTVNAPGRIATSQLHSGLFKQIAPPRRPAHEPMAIAALVYQARQIRFSRLTGAPAYDVYAASRPGLPSADGNLHSNDYVQRLQRALGLPRRMRLASARITEQPRGANLSKAQSLKLGYAVSRASTSSADSPPPALAKPAIIRLLEQGSSTVTSVSRSFHSHRITSAIAGPTASPADGFAVIPAAHASLDEASLAVGQALADVRSLARRLGVILALPTGPRRLGAQSENTSPASGAGARGALATSFPYAPHKHGGALNWLAANAMTRRLRAGTRSFEAFSRQVAQVIAKTAGVIVGLEEELRLTRHFANKLSLNPQHPDISPAVKTPGALGSSLMARALWHVAAPAALASPLLLGSGGTGKSLAPTAWIPTLPRFTAASESGHRSGQTLINYSPNLTINAPETTAKDYIAGRVMEVLERHGRELHHILERELLRRQRTEF